LNSQFEPELTFIFPVEILKSMQKLFVKFGQIAGSTVSTPKGLSKALFL